MHVFVPKFDVIVLEPQGSYPAYDKYYLLIMKSERDKWEFSDFTLSLTKRVEKRMRVRERKALTETKTGRDRERDREREGDRVIEIWVVRSFVLT